MKTLEEKIREKFPRHMSFVECIRETSDVDLAEIIMEYDSEVKRLLNKSKDVVCDVKRSRWYIIVDESEDLSTAHTFEYFEDYDNWHESHIPSYFGIASRFAFRVHFKDINFDPIVVLKSYEIGNSLFNNIRMISFTKS